MLAESGTGRAWLLQSQWHRSRRCRNSLVRGKGRPLSFPVRCQWTRRGFPVVLPSGVRDFGLAPGVYDLALRRLRCSGNLSETATRRPDASVDRKASTSKPAPASTSVSTASSLRAANSIVGHTSPGHMHVRPRRPRPARPQSARGVNARLNLKTYGSWVSPGSRPPRGPISARGHGAWCWSKGGQPLSASEARRGEKQAGANPGAADANDRRVYNE